METTPDFSLVLKVCREFYDVTSAGKLFHVRAAATGNARLPTVDSRVDGTSNAAMPTSTMTAGVVDRESWQPVANLQNLPRVVHHAYSIVLPRQVA